MKGFTAIKGWRKMNMGLEDEVLYDKNNEFRASIQARMDGNREYNRDFKKRMQDTDDYCAYIGRSYDDILRFGL